MWPHVSKEFNIYHTQRPRRAAGAHYEAGGGRMRLVRNLTV